MTEQEIRELKKFRDERGHPGSSGHDWVYHFLLSAIKERIGPFSSTRTREVVADELAREIFPEANSKQVEIAVWGLRMAGHLHRMPDTNRSVFNPHEAFSRTSVFESLPEVEGDFGLATSIATHFSGEYGLSEISDLEFRKYMASLGLGSKQIRRLGLGFRRKRCELLYIVNHFPSGEVYSELSKIAEFAAESYPRVGEQKISIFHKLREIFPPVLEAEGRIHSSPIKSDAAKAEFLLQTVRESIEQHYGDVSPLPERWLVLEHLTLNMNSNEPLMLTRLNLNPAYFHLRAPSVDIVSRLHRPYAESQRKRGRGNNG